MSEDAQDDEHKTDDENEPVNGAQPDASGDDENGEDTDAKGAGQEAPNFGKHAPTVMFEPTEKVSDQPVEEELIDSYLTYAMSTIMDRALPDIRDGLKPSQRRVLVAMNDLGLGPRTKHIKCAKIAGDTSGNYHPHGEGVVYPTLVRMGQEWNLRYPLVHPQGNFGSIDGDPPAAMRYTEARLTGAANDMMADLNLDTVDMQPNYDDRLTEPTVLPAKIPNLLVNGSQGIAVGMATSMPPHNMREVCDGLIHLIANPDATVEQLMKFVKGPDFPTGGLICGRAGIVNGYKTGRGKIVNRAKMHTEQTRGGRTQIVVTEIPYQVLKTTIVERIADVVKDGRIPDISDVQDHSDRDGMRIIIELKKGVEPEVVINQLYQYTPLQSTFSIINIALVNRAPRTLTLRDMMIGFLEHRKDVIRRRTMFLLRRARQRAHILEGLILAVADIDTIIEIIKKSPDVPTARQRLMDHALRLTEKATVRTLLPEIFIKKCKDAQYLTHVQADAILIMQLQKLTGLEIEKLASDYGRIVEEIEGYELILGDERRLLDIIIEDIKEIREKYGDERRTEIVGDVGDFEIEDLIAEEDVVVTLSHEGYIKRMPLTTYRKQGRGGQGIIGSDAKEGDWVEELFIASTHDYLLIFLSTGRLHWLKVYDIPSMSRQSKGRSIVNLLAMPATEKICAVVATRDFDASRFLVTATKRGQIKKTSLDAYSNVRKGGIQATGLDEGDHVIDVAVTHGSDEIILGTADGKAIRFKETNVRSMGRTAAGVRGIDLRKGDEVVDMVIIDPMATLLTVCENGHGKRTDFDQYRIQTRGGLGIINIKTTERNGKVVAMKSIRDADELMIITQNGMIVRTGVSELRTIGRATQGVRVISLKPGDKVVGVARVVAEDNAQGQLPLDNSPQGEIQPELPLSGPNDDAPSDESDGDITNL